MAYYVKGRNGTETEISEDNVFARCCECGKRIEVDLEQELAEGSTLNSEHYCSCCGIERARKHPNEDWARQVLAAAGELDDDSAIAAGESAGFADGFAAALDAMHEALDKLTEEQEG